LYSEGFKAGGFQHDARNQAQLDLPIGNEEVTNFELGWKGSYDRARFAVTLFDMQNEGTQVNALIAVGNTGAFTTVISNAGGVDTQGVEFDGTFLLTDNFILGGTLAVFDGALTDTIISAAVNPITGEVEGEDVSGQRPNNVPDQTYSLYGEYDINLNSGSIITLRADVRNRSDVWRRLPDRADLCQCSAQTPEFLSPEFTQYGVRLSWTSAGGDTSLSLWGRNLGDDFDYKNIGPRTGRTNQLQGTRGVAGREDYGVDFSMRF
jgi:outer membrane receptor protein involved in Fe transport